MRRLIWVLVAAGLLGVGAPAAADSLPGGGEGCVVNGASDTGAGPTHALVCTYVATRPAGYVAVGPSWRLKIVGSDGTVSQTTSGDLGPVACTRAIVPGDTVTISVPGPGTLIAAGNPLAPAVDALLLGAGNRCTYSRLLG